MDRSPVLDWDPVLVQQSLSVWLAALFLSFPTSTQQPLPLLGGSEDCSVRTATPPDNCRPVHHAQPAGPTHRRVPWQPSPSNTLPDGGQRSNPESAILHGGRVGLYCDVARFTDPPTVALWLGMRLLCLPIMLFPNAPYYVRLCSSIFRLCSYMFQ